MKTRETKFGTYIEMEKEDKIEINVKNGDNFHMDKDVYIQWLKAFMLLNLEKENYGECAKLRDEIKSLGEDF